uniref:Uncharacterized protein n=1 Tax=Salix viminalis TaxID=40686 RepID=A0A6N2K9E5_SALVM
MVIQLGLRVERTLHHLQQGKIPMPLKLCGMIKILEPSMNAYQISGGILYVPFRAFVPAVLLGEAEPKANEHSVKTQDQSNIKANPPKIWQRFLQSLALCRREKVQRRGRIRKKKIKKR